MTLRLTLRPQIIQLEPLIAKRTFRCLGSTAELGVVQVGAGDRAELGPGARSILIFGEIDGSCGVKRDARRGIVRQRSRLLLRIDWK